MECTITTSVKTSVSYQIVKTLPIDGSPMGIVLVETDHQTDAKELYKMYAKKFEYRPDTKISLVRVETKTILEVKEVYHNKG